MAWKVELDPAAVRRVGDYRLIARIEDDALRVLAVRVGSRGKVYR